MAYTSSYISEVIRSNNALQHTAIRLDKSKWYINFYGLLSVMYSHCDIFEIFLLNSAQMCKN